MSDYNPRLREPEKIVKCACGLPMRQKNWAVHWRGCHKGYSVEVTEQDVKALLRYEEHRRQQDAEHEKWLNERGHQK